MKTEIRTSFDYKFRHAVFVLYNEDHQALLDGTSESDEASLFATKS